MKKLSQVEVGSDCFSVGFPTSIGLAQLPQIDRSAPLLRKGIVAGLNRARGVLVLDCPVYKGDSGGPIVVRDMVPNVTKVTVMQEGSTNVTSFMAGQGIPSITSITYSFTLIGVQVEMVPFVAKLEQNPAFGNASMDLGNSGYSIAEPMDAVMDLIGQ